MQNVRAMVSSSVGNAPTGSVLIMRRIVIIKAPLLEMHRKESARVTHHLRSVRLMVTKRRFPKALWKNIVSENEESLKETKNLAAHLHLGGRVSKRPGGLQPPGGLRLLQEKRHGGAARQHHRPVGLLPPGGPRLPPDSHRAEVIQSILVASGSATPASVRGILQDGPTTVGTRALS